jgi:dTDP-4-dehydrorhamnose reductase
MDKSKSILITGGTGLLALNWACALRDDWNVILGTHHHSVKLNGVSSQQLHLDSEEQFGSELDELSPDLVINTASMTSVEQCQENPGLAYETNALVARTVARATAQRGIRLVHISTDHLFAGDRSFYQEEAQPQPLNEYAKTKLNAEEYVLLAHTDSLIIRTNFFCWGHAHRQSFTDWLIYNLREGKKLTLFNDIFFTPILADNLALATHQLIEKGASGIFNVVGNQRLSKYQFAINLCEEFGLPTTLIQPRNFAEINLSTVRPKDMSLSNNKVQRITGSGLGKINDFLADLHKQEKTGRRQELLNSVYQ